MTVIIQAAICSLYIACFDNTWMRLINCDFNNGYVKWHSPKVSIPLVVSRQVPMMTSSNGNIFRVTGHLCGEFTGPRWIPPHNGQWRGALMFSLICARINGWVNNREAGDLRRHRVHYDVIVMHYQGLPLWAILVSRPRHEQRISFTTNLPGE